MRNRINLKKISFLKRISEHAAYCKLTRHENKVFYTGLIVLLFVSCSRQDSSLPGGTTPFKFEQPSGWPQPEFNFQANPLTVEGVELGRRLFYDGRLSKDGNFPCASCHQQFAAFATFDHNLSHGVENQFTTRNAPGMFNLAWHKEFHWDGGINHLEVQPLAPITALNEMGETMPSVISKISADSSYRMQFKKAFGNETVTTANMMKALSQFMAAMVSANSKYDKVKRGQASFTTKEQIGYDIFKSKCASCHTEPLFTDLSYRNNGLSLDASLDDKGRMRITNLSADSLKFKVPSLRNIMLTFPYMHDGRFTSPLQVLDHYSDGVIKSATLDPALQNGIPLTLAEKFNLMDFFYTLTDSTFIKDERFAAPR